MKGWTSQRKQEGGSQEQTYVLNPSPVGCCRLAKENAGKLEV
jgi:hypothetical protein